MKLGRTHTMGDCAALIVAAGRGRRFGGEIPKQYRMLGGISVLRRTLLCFVRHPRISAVRGVIHPDDGDLFAEAAQGLDILEPVPGGALRQDSVRLGLESLAGLAPDTVLIQDAARPFVDQDLISRVLDALETTPAAIPALPVSDTLKRQDETGRLTAGTVDRAGLWRAQTPQGFRYGDIMAAHQRFAGAELTDDAAVAEQAGLSVALVQGSEENEKVTTQADLERAERLLGGYETRIGTGFDVHRFGAGDHVILCGVTIPFDFGLEGHSDADVGMHALTDALLGAIPAGDIGLHFPPSDPQWRGAPSETFLRHAADLVRARGRIVNVDVTLICENPKITPYRQAMIENISSILDLDVYRVSIKGTTTEKLGFTGRGEGIAAQAAVSVRLGNAS